ncbi:MAG: hypothetical protein JXN65_07210 [Clostridia bacterium]|nr:hypothetical protein [Clostridia bacterium]
MSKSELARKHIMQAMNNNLGKTREEMGVTPRVAFDNVPEKSTLEKNDYANFFNNFLIVEEDWFREEFEYVLSFISTGKMSTKKQKTIKVFKYAIHQYGQDNASVSEEWVVRNTKMMRDFINSFPNQ